MSHCRYFAAFDLFCCSGRCSVCSHRSVRCFCWSIPCFAPRVFPALGALIAAVTDFRCAGRTTRDTAAITSLCRRRRVLHCFSDHARRAYSSAASEQRRFEDRIASSMHDDLAQLNSHSPLSNYVLIGSAGYAPAARHAMLAVPDHRATDRTVSDAGPFLHEVVSPAFPAADDADRHHPACRIARSRRVRRVRHARRGHAKRRFSSASSMISPSSIFAIPAVARK